MSAFKLLHEDRHQDAACFFGKVSLTCVLAISKAHLFSRMSLILRESSVMVNGFWIKPWQPRSIISFA